MDTVTINYAFGNLNNGVLSIDSGVIHYPAEMLLARQVQF